MQNQIKMFIKKNLLLILIFLLLIVNVFQSFKLYKIEKEADRNTDYLSLKIDDLDEKCDNIKSDIEDIKSNVDDVNSNVQSLER